MPYPSDCLPVPQALRDFHADELNHLAQAGTWLSGEERIAIALYTRQCRAELALQAADNSGLDLDAAALLPAAMLELIAALACRPQRYTRSNYTRARDAGLSEGEYAETVSLIARVIQLDVFARGVGVAPLALPPPEDGEPSLTSPPEMINEGAWIKSVPSSAAGGETATRLYGPAPAPFIYRALSSVPAEAERIISGGNVHYLTLDHFFDFNYSLFPSLTRAELETVAAGVSAHNACFY